MKKKSYLPFIIGYLMFSFYGFSQEKTIWTSIEKNTLNENILNKELSISNYSVFKLELKSLKNKIHSTSNNTVSSIVEFPNNEGKLLQFKIRESPILHPVLASKYPSLKSYIGQSIGNSKSTIYFSTSPLGLYAMILSPGKRTTYIDPILKNRKIYKVYLKKDILKPHSFDCLTQSNSIEKKVKNVYNNANDLKLRTFRLALAATEEYSNYHINAAGLGANSTRNDSITVVLAAMLTTISRVNAVFERDAALTMQLVPNNDLLIFLETDPGNDPYTNDDKSAMLTQNQTTIDNIIGQANYDIGHVFSYGGGGVAYKGSVCGISKAGGVTGSTTPVGDPFDIDYVAHEMGHQYGANHTFNSTASNCGNNNRNNATAVEPGSGSTIMGYAGICAPENVQSHSDSYFHSISINEIVSNITSGNSLCAIQTDFTTNFNAPTANAGNDFIIPKSTPFVLKGIGTDVDGDPLTFCWEQTDNEVGTIQVPPSTTQPEGAVFRSISPILSPKRYFPSLPSVILGGNATWEVLPSVARTLHFDFTVRDNIAGEGQTATDNMVVTINDNAGPFKVTSQNSQGVSWTENGTETITWDVAGTDANSINVTEVNILLSVNGGLTFPIILATNTPNDGQEQITVPSFKVPNARVMVEAVDHIFYAVNSEPFSIGSFVSTCTTYSSNDTPVNIPDNNQTGVESILNISEDFTVTDVNLNVDITHSWIRDLQIFLTAPNGTQVLIYDRSCGDSNTARVNINATFDDEALSTICDNSNPAISGLTKPDNLLFTLNGLSSFGDWKLKVVDNANQDTGILNQWSLELCKTEQTVGINNYFTQSISIYPNPFKNSITISFKKNSIDKTIFAIYDISGRLIYHMIIKGQDYKFTKELDLSNLDSGIYILNIQQGSQKISKKIIKY